MKRKGKRNGVSFYYLARLPWRVREYLLPLLPTCIHPQAERTKVESYRFSSTCIRAADICLLMFNVCTSSTWSFESSVSARISFLRMPSSRRKRRAPSLMVSVKSSLLSLKISYIKTRIKSLSFAECRVRFIWKQCFIKLCYLHLLNS